MRESIEKSKKKKEEKEKTVIEKIKEIKEQEIEKTKEDKNLGSPWPIIKPELLTDDAQELYAAFEQGDFEVAQGKLEEIKTKIENIKKDDVRLSNDGFVRWIDDKIAAEVARKELGEEKEKDN